MAWTSLDMTQFEGNNRTIRSRSHCSSAVLQFNLSKNTLESHISRTVRTTNFFSSENLNFNVFWIQLFYPIYFFVIFDMMRWLEEGAFNHGGNSGLV